MEEKMVRLAVCGNQIKIDEESFDSLSQVVSMVMALNGIENEEEFNSPAGQLTISVIHGMTKLFNMALFHTEEFRELADECGIKCMSARIKEEDEELYKAFTDKIKEFMA